MDKRFIDQIIDWPKMRDNLRLKTNLGCKDDKELLEGGFMDQHLMDQFIDHLRFLGYEVEIKQGRAICLHGRKNNFIIIGYFGGFYLRGLFLSTDFAKENKVDYLSFINQMNREALIVCFHVDDKEDITFNVWFPGTYDKKQFGVFMDLWDHDINEIFVRLESEINKFIG